MMQLDHARSLVRDLYTSLLRREPGEQECSGWAQAMVKGSTFEQVFHSIIVSPEFKRRAAQVGPATKYPPGHYHSPVVDPTQLAGYLETVYQTRHSDLAGIDIDPAVMQTLWSTHEDLLRATPFTADPVEGRRFFYGQGSYPVGDATTLRLMMAAHRPRRVIEIGSGASSACVLDCADEFKLDPFALTCIEPYPARLHSFLRDTDTVEILDQRVEDVDVVRFDSLDRNDILLIDSTHVMKTGSDVCHEIFNIIPRLRSGVLIHVHDCQYPFEYPRKWVLDQNLSWNEAYAIRAFLMFNTRVKVYFWNTLFARLFTAQIRSVFPDYLKNPGSTIWLRVT
jgi:hypothetical protein